MAKHIKPKHDEVSGMSKRGIVERNQEGDEGNSQVNKHSSHD